VALTFTNVETEFNALANAIGQPSLNTGAGVNELLPSAREAEMKVMNKRTENLEQLCASLVRTDKTGSQAVWIGKYCFENMEELHDWAVKTLPANLPFGSFLDAYSFFQRVNSHKDVRDDRGIIHMEKRSRVNLTTDKEIVVRSFGRHLPKCFSGGSSEDSGMMHWLPGIEKKAQWEDDSRLNGVKIMIHNNTEVIRSRMQSIIKL